MKLITYTHNKTGYTYILVNSDHEGSLFTVKETNRGEYLFNNQIEQHLVNTSFFIDLKYDTFLFDSGETFEDDLPVLTRYHPPESGGNCVLSWYDTDKMRVVVMVDKVTNVYRGIHNGTFKVDKPSIKPSYS